MFRHTAQQCTYFLKYHICIVTLSLIFEMFVFFSTLSSNVHVSGSELLVKWFEQGCNTPRSDSHMMGNTRDVISCSQSSEGGVNNTITSQPSEDQDCRSNESEDLDCSEVDEEVNVNVSLSPSLQESPVGGGGIASLAVPSAPSSAAGAEVPTEGKLQGHLSMGLFEKCSLIKMCSYFFVQKYTF
jgi:hypothetical protein